MSVIPIVLFHDRALLQDKDWAYATECTIAYVDDDDLKMQEDFDKTVIVDTQPLIEALAKPKNLGDQGFFIT